jgi:hypothetical protein
MQYYVTYNADGRTGNNLFQYLACKLIEIIFKKHTYVVSRFFNDIISDSNTSHIIFTDELFEKITNSVNPREEFPELLNAHIYCNGYFQRSKLLVQYRNEILKNIYNSDDILDDTNCTYRSIYDFLHTSHNYKFTNDDMLISLRLDDFFQAPCKTSDIIPPTTYLDILSNSKLQFNKLYIVCDKLKHKWEYNYIKYFEKYNPILIQGSLEHDSAIMRTAPRIIHSNSTLCWLSSYFSENKIERHIPRTNMYMIQDLGVINELTDKIYIVRPMEHKDVLSL